MSLLSFTCNVCFMMTHFVMHISFEIPPYVCAFLPHLSRYSMHITIAGTNFAPFGFSLQPSEHFEIKYTAINNLFVDRLTIPVQIKRKFFLIWICLLTNKYKKLAKT